MPAPAGSGVSDAARGSKDVSPPDAATAPRQDAEPPGTPIPGPTGLIEGIVTYAGDEIPTSTIVDNGTDPQICGAQVSKEDAVISPDTRGIRYVLVGLEDVKLPDGYRPPRRTLVLDNKNCQFEPHAAVLTVGSTIETRNSDEVYHTTNLQGKPLTMNIPLPTKGSSQSARVRQTGLIGVKCDKHGWMQAFIRVDSHPFHAVTDADGKFRIADVPAGTYKLKAWHERFFAQELQVTVNENATTAIELKYPAEENDE
jgi:hypothetical protein